MLYSPNFKTVNTNTTKTTAELVARMAIPIAFNVVGWKRDPVEKWIQVARNLIYL
jgi:hypothetical protein